MISTIINILLVLMLVNPNKDTINIAKYLQKHLKDYNRIEFTIVAPKNIDLDICSIDESRMVKVNGSFAYLPVKELNQNGSYKNTLLTLKVKLFKNVLVSSKSIIKKEYLSKNDFKIEEKEVSELRIEPVGASIPIDYYRAKLRISENSILQKSMLEKIPDVKIGDRIDAVYVNNSVNVEFAVTARSEGVSGDIIKVKRDDKRIFKARIINNSLVKIVE